MSFKILIYLFAVISFYSCTTDQEQASDALFRSIDVASAGITFANQLTYTEEFNVYTFRNFYNGAGVGLGDFNRDGLLDIFFCGNQVDNQLYFNTGDLTFENVTDIAGVASKNVWTTGVSIADINADGWLDIYVCKSGDSDGANRHNELFINNGEDADGRITFSEQSKRYGLDDIGLATHAVFLDYDLDGDLDCYLLNNSFRSVGNYDLRLDQRKIRDTLGGNKLLRNNMIGTTSSTLIFEDVSEEAGIYGSAIGFGLGVTFGDVNQDGYPDLYVSNDFFEKDYLYINNQDGTFSERSDELIMEMSMGSMGADMADINNDGLQDIFVTEMLPRQEQRKKTKSLFEDWNKYSEGVKQGYHNQFARNVLQLNNGEGKFAEIGRLTGVEATDWSWGALFFDIDNDGWKDLFVANGIYKDLLDQDYINFYSNPTEVRKILFDKDKGGLDKLVDMIPSEAIGNYVFKNQGGVTFDDKSVDWGMSEPTYSNGAAYGDLDNDGDLDLVINNINAVPMIYENQYHKEGSNFLQVTLNHTTSANYYGIGATITIYYQDRLQSLQVNPARGFMSTSDARAHFGLENIEEVDSIVVLWPNRTKSVITKPSLNREIKINNGGASLSVANVVVQTPGLLRRSDDFNPVYGHIESDYSDFDRENLLLSMNSNLGPAICDGDINGDGLTDFYIGGAKGQEGALFVQERAGEFREIKIKATVENKGAEDVDCIFYHANDDDLLDLYVASGSTEFGPNNVALADRLYINIGREQFEKSAQILPTFNFENTSSVDAIDFDSDGDMDLVVATYIKPFNYGLPSNTYLLENDGIGNYKNVTSTNAPELQNIGMVTSVSVADIDTDGDDDIILAGDWMPVHILYNTDGQFTTGDNQGTLPVGLWSSLKVGDIDGDGDQDIIAGNHGLNSRLKASSTHPLRLYLNDFDQNGKVDQIYTYENDEGEYPLAQRGDLLQQLPQLRKKFPDYNSYGGKVITDVFDKEHLASGLKYELTELRSCVIWNRGEGDFEVKALPMSAQLSPVYGVEVADVDGDGMSDIILGGNQSRSKPELGTYMASYGAILLGSVDQEFISAERNSSGLAIEGEVRGIKNVGTEKKPIIVVAKNNDKPVIYKKNEINN